jgi:hypothetical protein
MSDHPRPTHEEGATPPRPPAWRRIHHSAFFWVAIVFLFLAMGIFVLTDGFLLRPRPHLPTPAPAASGP